MQPSDQHLKHEGPRRVVCLVGDPDECGHQGHLRVVVCEITSRLSLPAGPDPYTTTAGIPARSRTSTFSLWRPVLYQLSYGHPSSRAGPYDGRPRPGTRKPPLIRVWDGEVTRNPTACKTLSHAASSSSGCSARSRCFSASPTSYKIRPLSSLPRLRTSPFDAQPVSVPGLIR